jgi:hypothetical protein
MAAGFGLYQTQHTTRIRTCPNTDWSVGTNAAQAAARRHMLTEALTGS